MPTTPEPRKRGQTINLRYVVPAGRKPTQYEEVTLHTQWDPKNFAQQGWFSPHSDGRPVWDPNSTRLEVRDWWAYRDPARLWFRPYVEAQARQEEAIELASEGAKQAGYLAEIDPSWVDVLAHHYAAYRFYEYGLFLSLSYAQREALSDVVATPIVFQGLDKDRHAQAIALFLMDLEESLPGFPNEAGKQAWMEDPLWQPAREYVERLMACRDWGEILVAINLALEPLASTLFTREYLGRFAPRHGDPVTAVAVETVANDRARSVDATAELVRFAIADTPANRAVVQDWLDLWGPRACRVASALAPLFEQPAQRVLGFNAAWERVFAEWRARLDELGLDVPDALASAA